MPNTSNIVEKNWRCACINKSIIRQISNYHQTYVNSYFIDYFKLFFHKYIQCSDNFFYCFKKWKRILMKLEIQIHFRQIYIYCDTLGIRSIDNKICWRQYTTYNSIIWNIMPFQIYINIKQKYINLIMKGNKLRE